MGPRGSKSFGVLCGLRVCIYSPLLFWLIINSIVTNLKKTGVGVKCRSMTISTLFYADIAVIFVAEVNEIENWYLNEVVQEMVSRSECREMQGYAHKEEGNCASGEL